MQFTVALVSLVTVATAASVPRQSDPHMIDFRSYGAAGCFAENQGVYTYEQSDAGTCIEYPSELDVESILLVDITIDGCSCESSSSLSALAEGDSLRGGGD